MDEHYSHIKSLLTSDHSKRICDLIIEYVGDDVQRFKSLMDLFFSDDWLMNQRAAWPIPIIVRKYPHLIQPYKEKLILNLENPSHNAVVRNTIRMFEGRFYQFGLQLLTNIKEPVANKVFAMTVMYKIAEPYPELLSELKLIIETQLPYEKPGFKSRGKKTLILIEKRLETIP